MDADAEPRDEGVEFVSEPIRPEPGAFRTDLMAQGLAAPPGAFTWRGRRYEVVECLSHEKRTAREGHTSGGERYLRRQEFVVRLDSGQLARLYVTRQPPRGAGRESARKRWFLYSITSGGAEPGPWG